MEDEETDAELTRTRAGLMTVQTRMSKDRLGIPTALLLGTCRRMCNLVAVDVLEDPGH